VLHTNDLGGPDVVTSAEAAILRRACTLITELERMESRFATKGKSEPHELLAYQRCANSMRRLLEAVGIARRQRDITPSLSEYIARNYPAEDITPSVEPESAE
jgi:hypothetical protein